MSWAVDESDLIEPERMAPSTMDDIVNDRRKPPDKRRRLTVRELRVAIEYEATLVSVAASNMARGLTLSPADTHRVWLAAERIAFILEAMR